MRRPLALVGVGAGDLAGAAAPRLARLVVHAADLLILRDDESAALLAEAGAPVPMRVGADAAWTLPLARTHNGTGEAAADAAGAQPLNGTGQVAADAAGAQPLNGTRQAAADAAGAQPLNGTGRVGADALVPHTRAPARGDAPSERAGAPVVVALSHLAGGADLADRLADALGPLVRDGVPVVLHPWDGAADAALAAAVAARLPAPVHVPPPPADLAAAAERFATARLVVGLRFHALIAAATARTPFLAFVHEPKLAAVARRLGQPSVPALAPPATVSAAMRGALDAPPAEPAAIDRERERAEHAFRLLRVLLAGGRSDEAHAVDGLALRPEEWL
jgi:polysaccharide pyruvyl transferase WcaK-like protein